MDLLEIKFYEEKSYVNNPYSDGKIFKRILKYIVNNKEKQVRDIKISFIRMIAMFSIILCHFFQYYHLELAWWFNVGVQVFLC